MKTQLKTKVSPTIAVVVGVSAAAILGALAIMGLNLRTVLNNLAARRAVVVSRMAAMSEDGFTAGVPTLIYSAPAGTQINNLSLWGNKLAMREINSAGNVSVSFTDLVTRGRTAANLGGLQPNGYIDMNGQYLVFSSTDAAESNPSDVYLYDIAAAHASNISNIALATESAAYNPAIDGTSAKVVWFEKNSRYAPGSDGLVEYDLVTRTKTAIAPAAMADGDVNRYFGKSDMGYGPYRIFNNLTGYRAYDGDITGYWPNSRGFDYILHASVYDNRMVETWEFGTTRQADGTVTVNPATVRTKLVFTQFRIDPVSYGGTIFLEGQDIRSTDYGDPYLVFSDTAIYGNKVAWIENGKDVYVYVIPEAWRDLLTCKDGDTGLNYVTAASTRANGDADSDRCVDENTIKELYCGADTHRIYNSVVPCETVGSGMVCLDSRCVVGPDSSKGPTKAVKPTKKK